VDDFTVSVLDGFEANLAHHPRDTALAKALRAEAEREPGSGFPATARHPARWAAWTLYGDSGHQTDRRLLARWWHRLASAHQIQFLRRTST
jgi:hypothetical protein